jgi:predicted nucleic acid-binding protein
MRLLLDTNVLIDYFSERKPYHKDAFRLRIMHEFGDAELWASIQSFADIAYVLRDEASSEAIQHAFLESLEFIHVCSLDHDDLLEALRDEWEDFEDRLIEQCARKVKADRIITRDKNGFQNSKAAVCAPSEFFLELEQSQNITFDHMVTGL